MQWDRFLEVVSALNRAQVDVDGVCVRVVTPQTLHRMKKDTVRPQDRADALWLAERYGLSED